MANFNKKWSDLSDKRQQKLIDEYGSKQAWRDAKAKSQGYQDQSDKQEQKSASQNPAMNNAGTSTGQSSTSHTTSANNNNNSNASAEFKNPVDTKDGRIEAPSWYRNADGTTPSTMQPGMTKEKWERSLGNAAAKETGDDSRENAIKAADSYLASHPNRGKGGIKDAEYDRILKEGGLTNHTYQLSLIHISEPTRPY